MNLASVSRLVVVLGCFLALGHALTACGEPDPAESALSSCIEVCERTREECGVQEGCESCADLVTSLTADCQELLDDLQTCLLTNDLPLCSTGSAPDTCNAEQQAFDSACRDQVP